HQHFASACSIGRPGSEAVMSRAVCIVLSSSVHLVDVRQPSCLVEQWLHAAAAPPSAAMNSRRWSRLPCDPPVGYAHATEGTISDSTFARLTASPVTCPAIVGPSVLFSAPRYTFPIGVRAVEAITASVMLSSSLHQVMRRSWRDPRARVSIVEIRTPIQTHPHPSERVRAAARPHHAFAAKLTAGGGLLESGTKKSGDNGWLGSTR